MIRILTTIFLVVFFFNACAQKDPEATMSVTQLKEQLQTDSSLILLDVRTPAELESSLGKIDGVINIPLHELEGRLNELEDYKDYQIAVICRIGRRSGIATEILIKNGFKAKNVLGGMIEYRAAGNSEE
jgi:rhodanese-related sulfurtransferase